MTQRVEEVIEQKLTQEELREILQAHYMAKYTEDNKAAMKSLEIAEYSITPRGIIMTVKGLASVIRTTPDKIFAPPTRS
jgi:hypothetical protein